MEIQPIAFRLPEGVMICPQNIKTTQQTNYVVGAAIRFHEIFLVTVDCVIWKQS